MSDGFYSRRREFVSLSDSARIPQIGSHIIAGNTDTVLAKIRVFGGRLRNPLLGSEFGPMGSFGEIDRNACAFRVEIGQVELSGSKAVFRRGAVPFDGFCNIGSRAIAEIVEGTEMVLSHRTIVKCGRATVLKSKCQVLGNAEAMVIECAKIVFRSGVALQRGGSIIFGGLGVIHWDALAMFVGVTEKELRWSEMLRGGRPEQAKPSGVIGIRVLRVGIEEQGIGELELGDGVAGIGDGLKAGHVGNRVSLMRGWRSDSAARNGDKEKENERKAEMAMDRRSEEMHCDLP